MKNTILAASLTLLAAGLPLVAFGQEQAILDAAKVEGRVSVYSALDAALAQRLVTDFQELHPEIKVDYVDQSTTEIYNRAISEAAAGSGTADILLSSSMDLQYKLMSDGVVSDFTLPDTTALQPWSHAPSAVYGFTQEPLVIVYNKRLVPEADVPANRKELIELLAKPEYLDKVATIDPERIGTGFMFFTLDERADPDNFWTLADALGKARVKLYTSTGAMLEKVTSGEHLIAYNIIGSYAAERAKADSAIGVVYPDDYINAISRLAMIPKTAPHPNAGQVFLEYLVSERAQQILLASSFGTVRTDLSPATVVPEDKAALVRPTTVDDSLLHYLDQSTRLQFIRRWQQAMKGGN
ncbi:extracellular solute-binding protein [Paracoccus sp. DMF-8]|uniref:ABC transporter substrate-binding protein n=1 Tax=Paracoccus sp. DMF-8 TaxID=3019445 RepID=UPI0023E7B094|nr:extracellular solute-binding protein [Paracoccus sp. DMF-8]MDF3606691.1 extracellular solute-binding protein [Paracoccus sp. DMF-8]